MTDTLWAPWRMDYILRKKPAGCVFCGLLGREPARYREGLVLLVQPHAMVCLNAFPFASGHLLVVPRRHLAKVGELTDEEYDATMRLVRDTVACVEEALRPDGVNVGFNLGRAAGAGIADHLHGHVVPRWLGDQNFMPVVADTRVMPEHLDQVWLRLRGAFERLPGVKAADAGVAEPSKAR